MNRSFVTMLAGVAVVSCLAAVPASAGVSIRVGLPDAYIATTRPVYYEDHPTYRYRNRWHYRDHRGWHTYRTEPRYLRDYRSNHETERHYYGYGR
jgi:hypothetical protein